MTAAEIIREYRRKHSMAQRELGQLLGVTQQLVSLWEKGKTIDRKSCFELERITGYPAMVFLVAGTDKEKIA